MTRTRDKVALFCLLMLGAWGCGRGPATADQHKKQLESRTAKLESDLADTVARLNEAEQQIAREQARGRAADRDAQLKLAKEQARGHAIEKERDDLYGRLQQTAGQRDATQAHYESLVKKLEGVLTESKATLSKLPADDKTVTTTANRTVPNPSN